MGDNVGNFILLPHISAQLSLGACYARRALLTYPKYSRLRTQFWVVAQNPLIWARVVKMSYQMERVALFVSKNCLWQAFRWVVVAKGRREGKRGKCKKIHPIIVECCEYLI